MSLFLEQRALRYRATRQSGFTRLAVCPSHSLQDCAWSINLNAQLGHCCATESTVAIIPAWLFLDATPGGQANGCQLVVLDGRVCL